MYNFNKYLSVNELDMNWGFYITTVGRALTQPQQSYPDNQGHPSNHLFSWNNGRILDGYYLIYISKGKGIFESSLTKPIEVTAGTCFFLFPNVWHRYKPDLESGWEEFWVGFKGSYPDQLMSKDFFRAESPFVKTGLNEDIELLFHKLVDVVNSSIIGYPQIISGITLQILALVNSISLNQEYENDPNDLLVRKSKFLLQESLENPSIIEDIIRELPISYSKFRKLFKAATQLSPNQYLLEIRLNKAKELLRYTTLTINEIAYKTGFESVSYFSRFFKTRNKLSPSQYREMKKAKNG